MPDLFSPNTLVGATLRHRMLIRLRKLANQMTEEGRIDLVFLDAPPLPTRTGPFGRPENSPTLTLFSLTPEDWSYCLDSHRAHNSAIGGPEAVSRTS